MAHGPRSRTDRRARTLTGALAIAALLAALMALWQTQFRPLTKPEYCWGTWRADGGPFREDARHRSARETAPTAGRPRGRCSLSWSGGHGPDAPRRQLEVRYETGPRAQEERRAWVAGLFAGGDTALPDDLPGFVTADTGTLVLPESCDVDGRPSVVTVSGSFDSSPARTGRLLVEAANRATRATGCAGEVEPPPTRSTPPTPATPTSPTPSPPTTASPPPSACPAPIAGRAAARPTAGSAHDGFQTCAVAGDGQWAARFTMAARPRIVALFDGLTGDGPPRPGWRAQGRIEASGALIRTDCAGRPTVFAMRTGPGRTGTRLDDPRETFPDFVDAVASRIGCAPLHSV